MEEYASKPSRYSLWYCGVAIDTLLHYGKNPMSILPPQKIMEHWARLRIKQMTLDELKKEFFKQFAITKAAQTELSPLFEEVYNSLTSIHQDES
jgi:hypothetical protein